MEWRKGETSPRVVGKDSALRGAVSREEFVNNVYDGVGLCQEDKLGVGAK